jgi:hypothetical protein
MLACSRGFTARAASRFSSGKPVARSAALGPPCWTASRGIIPEAESAGSEQRLAADGCLFLSCRVHPWDYHLAGPLTVVVVALFLASLKQRGRAGERRSVQQQSERPTGGELLEKVSALACAGGRE